MKQVADFYISRNKEFSAIVRLVGVDMNPINLNGVSIYCDCVSERDETAKLLVLCSAINPTEGKLELFIPHEITHELIDGDWLYTLHMIYEFDGTESEPLSGKLIRHD